MLKAFLFKNPFKEIPVKKTSLRIVPVTPVVSDVTPEAKTKAKRVRKASKALAIALAPIAEPEPTPKTPAEIKADLKALKASVKKTEAIDRKARSKARIADDKKARAARKEKAKVDAKAKRETKGFEALPVDGKVRAVRATSKIAAIIDAISKPNGATLKEIAALTVAGVPLLSPKATVRGLLAFDLRGVLGYGYRSTDGERVTILYPKGLTAPIPHVSPATSGAEVSA